jgi:hypothetical protein
MRHSAAVAGAAAAGRVCSAPEAPVQLCDFIVCEDIRFEIGNKVTLVGIFSDEIILSAPPPKEVVWPAAIRLAVFARLRADEKRMPDRFKITVLHDGNAVGSFEGAILIVKPERAIHLTVMNQVIMPAPGPVSFSLDLHRGPEHLGTLAPVYRFELRAAVAGRPDLQ